MEREQISIPIFPEFYELLETIGKDREVAKDVLTLSLISYAETGSTYHAEQCLPGYLYKPFAAYVDVLQKYWKRRGQ